jgi:hypothetical protein
MAPVSQMPDSKENNLHIVWVALVGDNTGGSVIGSYNLYWEKASNEASLFDLVVKAGNL